MTAEEVRQGLCVALGDLDQHDGYLLQVDANERSITHRLAIHVASHFSGWDVDCEYNRNIADPKRLSPIATALGHTQTAEWPRDEHARTVFPDIVVHRRGSTENLLVIEVKKASRPFAGCDEQKVQAYLDDATLRYQFGAYVVVSIGASRSESILERFLVRSADGDS